MKPRDIIHNCKTIASKGNCWAVYVDKVNKSVWVREYNSSTGLLDYGTKTITPVLYGKDNTPNATELRTAYINAIN